MKKVKEMISKMQLHYELNKKKWIIGFIIALCVVLALVLAVAGVFHKKHRYNAEGIEICAKGDNFDITTGKPCKGAKKPETPAECAPGDKFSIITGEPCPETPATAETPKEEPKTDTAEAPKAEAPAPVIAPAPTPVVDTAPQAAAPKSGYEKALVDNAGKVISFDDACVSTPSELTVAKNTLVMMANNGTKSHTLALGGKSTTLAPKHYDLMFVGTGKFTPTCDGTNTGSVTAQ